MIDLCVDHFQHLGSESYALISAFEKVFAHKIGVLVEDDLVHIEFIKVCVKKALDDRFEFHLMILLSGIPAHYLYLSIVSLTHDDIQLYF